MEATSLTAMFRANVVANLDEQKKREKDEGAFARLVAEQDAIRSGQAPLHDSTPATTQPGGERRAATTGAASAQHGNPVESDG